MVNGGRKQELEHIEKLQPAAPEPYAKSGTYEPKQKRKRVVNRNTLFIKSIQDMKKSISQFISIFLMAMVAVIIVTGLDTIWATLLKHSNELYEITNTSDMWVTVTNPSEQDMWKIRRIDGIKLAEKRLNINADADLEGTPVLTVYGSPLSNTLDQPLLLQGSANRKTGAILDKEFAAAHDIKVGDRIKVEINDYWLQYDIVGLCISSEHIYSVEGNITTEVDPTKYGFIMVNIDSLKSAFNGMQYFNQIEIQIEEDADLNYIQDQLDLILKKKLTAVQKHNDSTSFSTVNVQIEQFRVLALVFPIMFFIVTALITLSTMMRLVEEQRNQIGTMKSLGYNKTTILWHYTSYGFYVGLLGVVFGCIIGPNTITRILMFDLKPLYILQSYQLCLYWVHIIIIAILIIFCTAGISAFSCNQLLSEMPAELLRTKPPKKGSHIFLERIAIVWNKMTFSNKLIARNLVRNKMRFFMSVFGIMGCTALILAAISLSTTMKETAEITYGKVYTYDEKLILDDKTSARFSRNLQLNGQKQTIQQGGMYVRTDNGYRKTISTIVTTAESPLINLPDKNGQGKLTMPENGVVITRKQAQMMDVSEGDTIYLKRSDDTYIPVIVTAITYLMEGQGIYMSDTYYEKIGETYTPTALLVKWDEKIKQSDQHFMNSDRVKNHITRLKQKEDFESIMQIIIIAAILLIVFGAVLAFVVIYNMGMLNFFERIRDLSTLMVLGFYSKEIQILVLFDNILSAALGVILGMPLGFLLTNIILKDMGDDFDLTSEITLTNIMLSALLTILFAIIVNWYLAKKMKTINMLEALKSVE